MYKITLDLPDLQIKLLIVYVLMNPKIDRCAFICRKNAMGKMERYTFA